MGCYQVLEENEGIEAGIQAGLRRCGTLGCDCVSSQRPALLVVSPRVARRGELKAMCRTALLPGEAGLILSGVQAASAVSYGTGARNTLTLSSREGRRAWAALQRELVTVKGHVVERQEFPLLLPPHQDVGAALAVAGALLLLGVPPGQLTS